MNVANAFELLPRFVRRVPWSVLLVGACGPSDRPAPVSMALTQESFDSAFQLVDTLKLEVDSLAPLVAVSGSAIAPNGDIVIADASERRVIVFQPDGTRRYTLGRSGDGPGEFRQPRNVAVSKSGDVLVAESQGRLHRFRGDSLVESIQLDSVVLISSLATAGDSTIYVTTTNGRSGSVVEFAGNGTIRRRVELFSSPPVREASGDRRWTSFLQVRGAACEGIIRAAASVSDSVWTVQTGTFSAVARRVAYEEYRAPRLPSASDKVDTIRPFDWIHQFDVIQGIFCSGAAFGFSYVRGVRNLGDPQVFVRTIDGETWRAYSDAPPVIAMKADTLFVLRDNGNADYILLRYAGRP